MNTEVINAFLESTSLVFKTMLGTEVTSETPVPRSCMVASGVSGIIGIAGAISGDVIVSLDERIAILATGALLGQEPPELNSDVVDAVGELTNMIAGGAKGRLERHELSLALPTVILGDGHRIGFKSGIQPVSIPFHSAMGSFSIELGLTEAKTPQCVC